MANASNSSDSETYNDRLASILECPVCFEFVLPPILQCKNGHIVCYMCYRKVEFCPTCRDPKENTTRNLAMEKMARELKFNCKYSSDGCTASTPYEQANDHTGKCEFRPYSCPCPGETCKWEGSLQSIMNHITISHNAITLDGKDVEFVATHFEDHRAVRWVMIQSCFNFNFVLALEKHRKAEDIFFFAAVQLIGSRIDAEKFIYRLELKEHGRRLTWEAVPRSIREYISDSDCLIFAMSAAQSFANAGYLSINVTIQLQ